MPNTHKTTTKTPKKKLRGVLDTLSDKLIADVVRSLPAKDREPIEAVCMGRALTEGEIVIPDGKDLPPAIRKANLARIRAIKDPKVRAAMLRGDTAPPKKKPRAKASV